MALLIGMALALFVGLFATIAGLDRDRAFYPTVTIVIGFLYALFAAMGASPSIIIVESLIGTLFLALAVFGFRTSLWVVVAALTAHGLFDLIHGHVITNPGVPDWWPHFCLAYDIAAAGYLAILICRGHRNISI